MKIIIRPAILTGLLLFSISCKQNPATTESTSTSVDSGFVAHPVAVPKQDVKALETGQSAPDFRLPDVYGK